jgi:hypothetical protein
MNKKIKELHDRLQLTRIEPIKHSKETISQYNKRCSEVLHRNISSINNNETDNIDKKVYQSLAKFYNKRIQKIKLNHEKIRKLKFQCLTLDLAHDLLDSAQIVCFTGLLKDLINNDPKWR